MSKEAEILLAEYSGHGVSFVYPGYWELSEESDGQDVILSVAVDETCFWLLRIIPSCPPAQQVLDSCLQAFREEYEDLESEPAELQISGMDATSARLRFSCVELLNTAFIGSVRVSEASLLCLWQCTDHELEQVESILDQMTQSITILSLLED